MESNTPITTLENKIMRNGKSFVQQMNLIANGEKLLSYSNTQGDLFSIVKKDNVFKLEFSEVGKQLLKLPEGMNISLDVSSASMLARKVNKQQTVGQEMELTVNINGKAGKLVANAEHVSFKSGSDNYKYKSTEDILSLNISEEAVKLAMGGEGTFFTSAPENYDNTFPLPLVKLIASAQKGNFINNNITLGKFTLRTFPAENGKKNFFLIDNTTKKGYLYAGSKFNEIKNYSPLITPEGKCMLAVGLVGQGMRGDYQIDLPATDGTLAGPSKDLLEMFTSKQISADRKSEDGKMTESVNNSPIKFEKKDSAYLNKIKADNLSTSYKVTGESDLETESLAEAEQPAEETVDSIPSESEPQTESENPQKDPEQENGDESKDKEGSKNESEQKEEDTNEEEPEENAEKKEEKEPEEISYKKPIEKWSQALMPLGLPFMLCGLIPGIGPLLLGLGIAISGTCIVLNVQADRFKYTQTFGAAEKIVSQAEKDALEDSLELANFIENENKLELAKERVEPIAEKLESLMLDQNSSINSLSEVYNKVGLGFNSSDNGEITRTHLLMGVDGHSIRETMQKDIDAIQNTTGDEKKANIDAFIKHHFTHEITPEDQKIVSDIFTKVESAEDLSNFATVLTHLNNEENSLTQLLSEQRVSLGGMRTSQISKVINNTAFEEKRDALIERYGSTLLRHFAIDENTNQAKLNTLFEKLPQEEKIKLIGILDSIGDRMESEMNAVEQLAQGTMKQDEFADVMINYIDTVCQLQSSSPIASKEEVVSNVQSYLSLQTYFANKNTVTKIEGKLAGLTDRDNIMKQILAVTGKGKTLKAEFGEVFDKAKEAGILDMIANGYVEGYNPIKITSSPLSSDEKLIEHIREILKADPTNPKYNNLRTAVHNLDSHSDNADLQKKYMKNLYTHLSGNKPKNMSADRIENFCRAEIAKRIKDAATAGELLNNQKLEILFKMIQNGKLAQYELATAENEAFNLAIVGDGTMQLESAVSTLTESINSKQQLDDIISRFPESDRKELLKIFEDKGITDYNQALVEKLTKMYDGVQLDSSIPSANKLIDNLLKNKIDTLLETLPNLDETQTKALKKKLATALQSPVEAGQELTTHEKIANVMHVLNEVYGDQILSESKLVMPMTASGIMEEWLHNSINDQLTGMFEVINGRAATELSTLNSDLGEYFANKLFDEARLGEKLDPSKAPELTKAEQKEIDEAKQMLVSIEKISKQFDSAWAKALNGELFELNKLLAHPQMRTATKEEKDTYDQKIAILTEMGVEVAQLEKLLSSMSKVSPDKYADTLNKVKLNLKFIEKEAGYSKLSKEFVSEKKKEVANMQIITTALSEFDKEYFKAEDAAEDAIARAENFANKYSAILSLKNPPMNYTEQQIKQVLYDVVNQNFFRLPKELQSVHFGQKDIDFIIDFLDKPEQIVSMNKDEVVEAIKQWVKEECEDYEKIKKQGEDVRKDPDRNEKLETAKKPKQVKNRISIIRKMFSNIKHKDELDKEEQARLEELGRTKLDEIGKEMVTIQDHSEEHSA